MRRDGASALEAARMDDLTVMTARIERLERRFRQVTLAFVLSLVALAIATLIQPARSQQIPEVVRAHRFELIDYDGKRRITLDAPMTGGPQIRLFDDAGAVRFEASVDRADNTLVTIGRPVLESATGARITLQTFGPPASTLSGMEIRGGTMGQGTVTVGVLPELGPGITLRDNGRQVFKAP
jgi:hypothetical protein